MSVFAILEATLATSTRRRKKFSFFLIFTVTCNFGKNMWIRNKAKMLHALQHDFAYE